MSWIFDLSNEKQMVANVQGDYLIMLMNFVQS